MSGVWSWLFTSSKQLIPERKIDEGIIDKRRSKREHVLQAALSFDLEEGSLSPQNDRDPSELREVAERLMEDLYPSVETKPTLETLIKKLLESTTMEWERGDWIEYRGDDMQWHLGQVRGVVHQAPDSFDWSDPANKDVEPPLATFYNISKESMLNEDTVRAPYAALRYMFGARPWVWQQYALLKTERYVRFQAHHERDFVEVDCQKLALDIWQQWLSDEKNGDFKTLYLSYGAVQRAMLVDHLLKPFELLDSIKENKEEWRFTDEDLSLYTYLSILGSGSLFVVFCMILQLFIPLLLLANALINSDHFNFEIGYGYVSLNTTWDLFCKNEFQVIEGDQDFYSEVFYDKVLGKFMILAVMFVYVLTVVPSTMIKFYRIVGEASTTYSRLHSLRSIVWKQTDDTLLQRLGFQIDRYMNTTYLVFLYGTMLFILFNTGEVLDVLLNALAAEFVHQIDEQIAHSEWYDSDKRWITVGTWQLAVQSAVELRIMDDPVLFCEAFDIDLREYCTALKSNTDTPPGIFDPHLASFDDKNPDLLGPEEALFQLCERYAIQKGNQDGIEQFQKPLVSFSVLDNLTMWMRSDPFRSGALDRMRGYRTWSRWNQIVFLAKVPPVATVGALEVGRGVPSVGHIRKYTTATRRFLWDIGMVLSLQRMWVDQVNLFRKRLYLRMPLGLFDSVIQWLAYVVQLSFPAAVLCGVVLIPICY